MSELICMSNVTCIFNSEARKITNLIQRVIVIQYKRKLCFIYTWLLKKSVNKAQLY